MAGGAGGIDAVVTAAGTDRCGTLVEFAGEDWDRVVLVNLLGTAAVVRAAMPYLLARAGQGGDHRLDPGGAGASSDATAYCASKFGVVGFTSALIAETAGAGRSDPADPWRHADALLRRPRPAVQAGPGRQAQPTRGCRRRRSCSPSSSRPAASCARYWSRSRPRARGPDRRDAPVALVLRALGLGDLLTAVPALRGVREALPEPPARAGRTCRARTTGAPRRRRRRGAAGRGSAPARRPAVPTSPSTCTAVAPRATWCSGR